MHCVFRSFDVAEADIIAGLLRAEGCTAAVFENGLSRLNWPYVIAYGGTRVMVDNAQRKQAASILSRWQRGEYALDAGNDLSCPRCQSVAVEQDPHYRGWAFVTPFLLFGLPLLWPFKWRQRCTGCRFRWQDVPHGDASVTQEQPA